MYTFFWGDEGCVGGKERERGRGVRDRSSWFEPAKKILQNSHHIQNRCKQVEKRYDLLPVLTR